MLFDWLRLDHLLERKPYADHEPDEIRAMLDVSEQIATTMFLPHNKRNDAEEPTFDGRQVRVHDEVRPALSAFAETGLVGATVDTDQGGLSMPFTAAQACLAHFFAANVSTTTYATLASGVANLILAHGSSTQIAGFVPSLMDGRSLGTMCLSEPHAGSSLSDITTRAVPQPDGSYRITGQKMWIGAAGHELSDNIIHLVLARIAGAPSGIGGISLFIVPKYLDDGGDGPGERNDVAVSEPQDGIPRHRERGTQLRRRQPHAARGNRGRRTDRR
ncbi:acyl-CoA dehydrogenase family protein [Rhodococcus olei]